MSGVPRPPILSGLVDVHISVDGTTILRYKVSKYPFHSTLDIDRVHDQYSAVIMERREEELALLLAEAVENLRLEMRDKPQDSADLIRRAERALGGKA
ncbi:MAG: hypothetical protein L3K18_09655 [Thermoplasmata archaeon]|nr:hypothetical protein [Thermoplasmata archaeon]